MDICRALCTSARRSCPCRSVCTKASKNRPARRHSEEIGAAPAPRSAAEAAYSSARVAQERLEVRADSPVQGRLLRLTSRIRRLRSRSVRGRSGAACGGRGHRLSPRASAVPLHKCLESWHLGDSSAGGPTPREVRSAHRQGRSTLQFKAIAPQVAAAGPLWRPATSPRGPVSLRPHIDIQVHPDGLPSLPG